MSRACSISAWDCENDDGVIRFYNLIRNLYIRTSEHMAAGVLNKTEIIENKKSKIFYYSIEKECRSTYPAGWDYAQIHFKKSLAIVVKADNKITKKCLPSASDPEKSVAIIKGEIIKLSDFVDSTGERIIELCPSDVETVYFFALHIFVIDTHFDDYSKLKIAVVAPKLIPCNDPRSCFIDVKRPFFGLIEETCDYDLEKKDMIPTYFLNARQGQTVVRLSDLEDASKLSQMIEKFEGLRNEFNFTIIFNEYVVNAKQHLYHWHMNKLINNTLSILEPFEKKRVDTVFGSSFKKFINEFQKIEDDYQISNHKKEPIKSYKSLLGKLDEFLKRQDTIKTEYKRVYSYIYTALLGKINYLEKNLEQKVYVNVGEYLKSLQKDLTEFNRRTLVNKHKKNYNAGINAEIEEAIRLIANDIVPEFDKIAKKINDDIKALLREIVDYRNAVGCQIKELKIKRDKLNTMFIGKMIFSGIRLISMALNFLGPVGTCIDIALEVGLSVAETIVSDVVNSRALLKEISQSVSNIASLSNELRIDVDSEVAEFKGELKKFSDDKMISQKLRNVLFVTNEMEIRARSLVQRRVRDSREIESFQIEVEEVLAESREEVAESEEKKKKEKYEKKMKVLESDFKKAKGMLKAGLDIKNQIQGNIEQIEELDKAIANAETEYKRVGDLEKEIYDVVIPLLELIMNRLIDTASKLGSKSKVSLEITKWNVQGMLKDMKYKLQDITNEFASISEDLSRSFEKLSNAMSVTINVYDLIQDYQNQKKFADYVANVAALDENDIPVDERFAEDIKNLNDKINFNIVLSKYDTAIKTFKQYVFPVASSYFNQLTLPEQLEQEEKTMDNFLSHAVKQLNFITEKLNEHKVSLTNNDKYINEGDFDIYDDIPNPFYVWTNEDNKQMIEDLLSGKEVAVSADLTGSDPDFDAVKFNVIDFEFKAKNTEDQQTLDDLLKPYEIVAVHMGNSGYRFQNKIYQIESSNQPISYYLRKNDKGEPKVVGGAYKKLKNGDFMLSPYALWKVKLVDTSRNASFEKLQQFRHKIDLALGGHGYFVDKKKLTGKDLKEINIDKYYDAVDTIDDESFLSLINYSLNFVKEKIDEINPVDRIKRLFFNEEPVDQVSESECLEDSMYDEHTPLFDRFIGGMSVAGDEIQGSKMLPGINANQKSRESIVVPLDFLNNQNLALLNFAVHKFNKVKLDQKFTTESQMRNEENFERAQKLAFAAQIPEDSD